MMPQSLMSDTEYQNVRHERETSLNWQSNNMSLECLMLYHMHRVVWSTYHQDPDKELQQDIQSGKWWKRNNWAGNQPWTSLSHLSQLPFSMWKGFFNYPSNHHNHEEQIRRENVPQQCQYNLVYHKLSSSHLDLDNLGKNRLSRLHILLLLP